MALFFFGLLVMCLGCKENVSDWAEQLQSEMEESQTLIKKTINEPERLRRSLIFPIS